MALGAQQCHQDLRIFPYFCPDILSMLLAFSNAKMADIAQISFFKVEKKGDNGQKSQYPSVLLLKKKIAYLNPTG